MRTSAEADERMTLNVDRLGEGEEIRVHRSPARVGVHRAVPPADVRVFGEAASDELAEAQDRRPVIIGDRELLAGEPRARGTEVMAIQDREPPLALLATPLDR